MIAPKSFPIKSENDTFDSVILESVKIESAKVDRHRQCYVITKCSTETVLKCNHFDNFN